MIDASRWRKLQDQARDGRDALQDLSRRAYEAQLHAGTVRRDRDLLAQSCVAGTNREDIGAACGQLKRTS